VPSAVSAGRAAWREATGQHAMRTEGHFINGTDLAPARGKFVDNDKPYTREAGSRQCA
jgi:hypothetical protein